jgi:hypothetical protein
MSQFQGMSRSSKYPDVGRIGHQGSQLWNTEFFRNMLWSTRPSQKIGIP